MKDWLEDLIDEYPTNRSSRAIARLARVFRETSDAAMQQAVDAYMLSGEKFFPKVGDLAPYVREAQEQARGPEPYSQVKRARYGRWRSETGEYYSDDELLAAEQERGAMPPDSELGTEWATDKAPQVDKDVLRRIKEAYQRIRPALEAA